MKYQSLFSGKDKKIFINLSCAELAQGVVKVKHIKLKFALSRVEISFIAQLLLDSFFYLFCNADFTVKMLWSC